MLTTPPKYLDWIFSTLFFLFTSRVLSGRGQSVTPFTKIGKKPCQLLVQSENRIFTVINLIRKRTIENENSNNEDDCGPILFKLFDKGQSLSGKKLQQYQYKHWRRWRTQRINTHLFTERQCDVKEGWGECVPSKKCHEQTFKQRQLQIRFFFLKSNLFLQENAGREIGNLI